MFAVFFSRCRHVLLIFLVLDNNDTVNGDKYCCVCWWYIMKCMLLSIACCLVMMVVIVATNCYSVTGGKSASGDSLPLAVLVIFNGAHIC